MDKKEVFESIHCPICGNDELQKVSQKGQFGLPCYVSICPSDGLVFLNPRWSKERYIHFYQSEYDFYYRPSILTTETDSQKKGSSLRLTFGGRSDSALRYEQTTPY